MKRLAASVVCVLLIGAAVYARIVLPEGVTCNTSPCDVPNSKTVYVTVDVDLTGAQSFRLVMNGNVAGQRAVSLADVTTYPNATITFPVAMGPGTYSTLVRTMTQYGWRDSDALVLHVPVGNPRVLVPNE
jgi:hypothetical protein